MSARSSSDDESSSFGGSEDLEVGTVEQKSKRGRRAKNPDVSLADALGEVDLDKEGDEVLMEIVE